MKFSKSLLNNGYVRERIFENGINKTRKILHYVFGDIYGVKEVVSHENFSYKAEFVFSDRPITALYRLDQEDDEIVKELIEICEVEEKNVCITPDQEVVINDFWDVVKKVQDYLENEFEIDFTPLDPAEKDEKIKDIKHDENNKTWQVTFTQDHQEGYFIATYKDKCLRITHYKKHNILLD
ncbi:MAG TPA: hypothetical protein PLF27_07475 [Sedimentibacter sp.]|jgi:hypothetical protein|nr:hypothetical protein [Defluviitaleaceae bacterium]HRC81210.1 hypothetical protein [Sedimentibacter sp.]